MGKPFTPETLAEHWDCSAETIRQMVSRGELPAFRVGRMIRITQKAVEDHECKNIESDGSMGDLSSHGPMQTASADAIALRLRRQRMQSVKPAT